jgi:hypothetical protein
METQLVLEAVQAAISSGRTQADILSVFNALAERMPRLKTDRDRWDIFIDLLVAAETEGLVVLPSRRGVGWNQEVTPARPQWVRLVATRAPRDLFDHRGFPWNPALSFLAGEKTLPTGIREAAVSIQQFLLKDGLSRPFVPVKERSFDIFGEEKRLGALQHSGILFGPGKLSLNQLRCYVVEPTPVAERFEQGRGIIILENEATFDSFCRLCRHKPTHRLVVYGRGHEIQKCAAYLKREAARLGVAEIFYFGDVDRRGLEIPFQLACELASELRVLPLTPAYNFLLRDIVSTNCHVPEACLWLPESLAGLAATIISGTSRIPQEAFGWEEMAVAHGIDPFIT